MIPVDAIDNREARGLKSENEGDGKASGFRVLIECKPLLILASCLAFFHLGNGAMLPLYGLAVVGAKQGNPAIFVAETIVIAQAVMIVASILAMRMAEKEGYWLVLLISFIALPIRGLVAAHLITAWGVYPVQMLDGIGAGLQSVAVPGLVARILNGTGRVNVGQGAVMTVQGLGRFAEPGDRRLARAMVWVSGDVHHPRLLRSRFDRALGRFRLAAQACLRVEGPTDADRATGARRESSSTRVACLCSHLGDLHPTRAAE